MPTSILVVVSVLPSNVKSESSCSSPDVPARTILPDVKSETFALARVASVDT